MVNWLVRWLPSKLLNMLEWKHITGKTGYINMDQSLVVTYDLDDRRTVLIDSGYRECPELISWSRNRGREIAAVLCTHLHVDHMGNNGLIQRKMKADIHVSRREYQVQQARFRSDDAISFEWMGREKYFFGDSGMYETTIIEPDQKSVRIGDAEFIIEDLSGHSPGHIGFATPDGVLHIGDAFMSDIVLRHSKLPYEYDITKTLETLKRIKIMDHPYYVASHRAVIPAESIRETVDANIAYHEKMLDEILQRLNGWQRMDRFILEVIANRGIEIRRSRSSVWLPVAVRSYIEHMIRDGRIETRRESLMGEGRALPKDEVYIKRSYDKCE